MNRGDLVTVAPPGDFGKPRPALVIQSDLFRDTDTVTVLLISSTFVEASLIRLPIEANEQTGLRKPSQVMIDKPMTVRRSKVGEPFGHLDEADMLVVTRHMALFLGFG